MLRPSFTGSDLFINDHNFYYYFRIYPTERAVLFLYSTISSKVWYAIVFMLNTICIMHSLTILDK